MVTVSLRIDFPSLSWNWSRRQIRAGRSVWFIPEESLPLSLSQVAVSPLAGVFQPRLDVYFPSDNPAISEHRHQFFAIVAE